METGASVVLVLGEALAQGAGLLEACDRAEAWSESGWPWPSLSEDLPPPPHTVVCPTGTSVTVVSLPLFSRRRLAVLMGAGAVVLVTGRCNTRSLPC